MTQSAIYEGSVRHRRFKPVLNTFRYRLFLMYLDLAELPTLFAPYRLWSLEKPNVATFRRRDYLGDPQLPLDQAVRDLVSRRTGQRPRGPIRMLTHLRYWGYCFNPVSFYYCFDSTDRMVTAIVAEITNTPWMERHQYVLPTRHSMHPHPAWHQFRFTKAFHVSPFMGMQFHYDWRFRIPGQHLRVHMNNHTPEGEKLFDATLILERRRINNRNLTRMLLKYPGLTARVTARIYWQALRLKLKGAPFHPHPARENT